MAYAVVDEAIRNVVAVGADPDRVALLDNFSWGDPRRPSTLGELVMAVEGCCGAARMYNAPFVSGKDSLNNEYVGSDGQRHAVPPTLVITAIAHVPDADHCITPDLSEPGNVLLLIGETGTEFAGSHLDMVCGAPSRPGVAPSPVPDAPADYRHLHAAMRAGLIESCHDVAEGGLAVTLAEMCIAGRLGATIDAVPHDDLATALFAESCGRLVVEVRPPRVAAFLKVMDNRAVRIGTVNDESTLRIAGVDSLPLDALVRAFQGEVEA
jgi:phosphoribosylformylglycinamidine synthase